MSYMLPVVREIVDPRSGRPEAVQGAYVPSQRDLVVASLLRVPAPRTGRAPRAQPRV